MEVATHRRPAHAQLLGDGLARPPLAVQGPHLLIEGQPPRPALAGELLGRRRGWGQWDGDGHSAIRMGDRGLTHRLMDRREHRAMRTAHLLQGLGHMLEQVKTVRDLDRLGCTLAGAVRRGFRPIAGHDLDPRMSREPLRQGASLAIVEEGHGPAALKVNEDRPIGLPFPIGPIIHPEDGGGGMHRQGEPTEHTQESVSADGSTQALA